MSVCVQYPSAGCIVEYLEGNAIQIALVTEESGGKLRLLLPNRRETRLTTSRLLPWAIQKWTMLKKSFRRFQKKVLTNGV